MPIVLDQPEDNSSSGGTGIFVAGLLRRIDNLMSDEDKVRWTNAERIDWINDAAREVVVRRPAARAITRHIPLVAGTFQTTPEGCAQLLDVPRNIKATGLPGKAIRITDRQALDDADPDWHGARAGETRHYVIDERSPTTFYVYPPAVSGALVEVLVAEPPTAVVETSDTLDLREEFINAIINWCLYRCHTKDSEYSQGAVAAMHYQAFTDAIGAPAQAAQVNSATGSSA